MPTVLPDCQRALKGVSHIKVKLFYNYFEFWSIISCLDIAYTKTMFTAEYLLFCAGKSVDENGNLSLHGIFDRLYAESFPAQHRPFKAVFKLTAKSPVIEKTIKLKIALTLENEEMAVFEGQLKVVIEQGNAVVPDVDLGQFVFPRAGNYAIALFVDGKKMIERTLLATAIDSLREK